MSDFTKSVIAVRHVSFEHLGTFEKLFRQWGYVIRYIDAGIDKICMEPADTADLLIMLGGPIGAYESHTYPYLGDEMKLIERRLSNGKPLIGICLGAQLIAHALGSKIYPGKQKEIGWSAISLTEEGKSSPLSHIANVGGYVLHWHGDTFDLPTKAMRLATTELTFNQAFSFGQNVLGLQFHIEIEPTEIESWLIGHACEISTTDTTSVKNIRSDTATHGSTLVTQGARVLSNWMTEAGLQAC